MLKKVKSSQITIIIPTKNRLNQLNALLTSLTLQTYKVGHIIVADGGENANNVVKNFINDLPIVCIDCPVKGQIAQRNHALSFLKKNQEMVAYLDDDLQLDSLAFKEILDFYNSFAKKPGGVSFNITNLHPQKNSIFRQLFFMSLNPAGNVQRSGYNAPITNVQRNEKVKWLLGGATLWRRDILENNKVDKVNLSWAVCEDLIFSYPISKYEQLYVCAKAKTLHIDDKVYLTYFDTLKKSKIGTLRRYEFVCQNIELSKILFFWMLIGQILGRIFLLPKNIKEELGYLIGTIQGLMICVKYLFLRKKISFYY